MAYDADPNATHNPAASTAASSTWGDILNTNAAYLGGAWETEAGTLQATTTDPGALAADVCGHLTLGKLLIVRYYFAWDGSTTDGSGTYSVLLPDSLSTVSANRQTISGVISLAGAVAAHCSAVWDSVATDPSGTLIKGGVALTHSSGWANGDYIILEGHIQLS